MARERLFKSKQRAEQRMKALEKKLKSTDISKLSAKSLTKFILDVEKVVEFKGEKQQEALNGFRASAVHQNLRNWNKRTIDLDTAGKQTLLKMAEQHARVLNNRNLTITGARAERSAKLNALREFGINRPTTKDIKIFWENFNSLKDRGLPYYLQKATGDEVVGLYVAVQAYNEFQSLPKDMRTDDTLREMITARFVNLQSSVEKLGSKDAMESAKENWERYHKKKLNRDLTADEVKTYSTFGVGEAVKQEDALADVLDYL